MVVILTYFRSNGNPGMAKRVRAKELPASFTAIAGNGLGVPLGFEVTLLDEEFTRSSALGVWTNFRLSKHVYSRFLKLGLVLLIRLANLIKSFKVGFPLISLSAKNKSIIAV